VVMGLEACISYINSDELVEVTPKSIRLRKQNARGAGWAVADVSEGEGHGLALAAGTR